MKALVYTKPENVQLQEYADPTLNPGEVIIKIHAVGICGSDMHAYHGHDPRRKAGLVMGHELSGVIEESASPLFKKGDKVTANPLIRCGYCSYCLEGRDNICENRTMVGMTRPGAYAEYMSIPAKSVIKLPEGMEHTVAVLTEPGATVLHALNLSLKAMHRPLPEQKALIIGGGAIGLMMALLLEKYGVRCIDLVETNPARRDVVGKYSKARPVDPQKENIAESSYNYVVDAVGRKVTRDMAVHCIRPGGVFMHIGLQEWGTEVDMRKLTLAEVTLLGTYTYTQADLHATLYALRDNVFGDLGWVDYRALSDGAQAFQAIANGHVNSAKTVLIP